LKKLEGKMLRVQSQVSFVSFPL